MAGIACFACKEPVRSRGDLVSAFHLLWPKPYHAQCYSAGLKSLQRTLFLSNQPVNGSSGTFRAVLGPAFAALWAFFLLFQSPPLLFAAIGLVIVALVLLFTLGARLYSYERLEKPLPA